MLRLKWNIWLGIIIVLSSTAVLAEKPNFETFSLSLGFTPEQGIFNGYTGGSVSLSSIQNKDSHHNPCIGFGSQTPDHIMILKRDFPKLKISVNTGGKDTTLLIKGPDETVHCGDDKEGSKDASIEDTNWKAGTYRIWVGAIETGQRWNYQLSVKSEY